MVGKTEIIDELGEHSLLLPEQVSRGLAANDRVKYYFTLLQSAKYRADHPESEVSDLSTERQASGVDDQDLDQVVAGSTRLDDGRYLIPGASRLHELIVGGVKEMIAPTHGANGQAGQLENGPYDERLTALTDAPAPKADDRVTGEYVSAITHARRGDRDSMHLLVMDLHKELNKIQAALTRESIDGAQVYRVEKSDVSLVKAFMRGLNATAPLKFDHPGLGTTAARRGDVLVIQNDIGTTDAHVLVVHVRNLEVDLTYTDIHIRRVQFFQALFENRGTRWDDTRSRTASGLEENDSFYLSVGRYEARDQEDVEDYLEFLGSRIVFLIDWNKARKRLRQFVRMRDAIDVLKWAADHNHGHRGFLELGGERQIFDAIEHSISTPIRYGERLDRLLGREVVCEFLKFVLRTCAEGLLEGRSSRSIHDEIKADLLERFHLAEQSHLALLGDHAALVTELAGAVRDGLLRVSVPDSEGFLALTAQRAKYWETRADNLIMQIRDRLEHAANRGVYDRLAHEADNVADHLEDVAFMLPLLFTLETPETFSAPLAGFSGLLVDGSRDFVRCIDSAQQIERGGVREDLRDFLESIDRIVSVEHATDEADRQLTASLIEGGAEHRQLHLLTLVGRRLEKAADSLSRCAFILRDHLLGEVMKA